MFRRCAASLLVGAVVAALGAATPLVSPPAAHAADLPEGPTGLAPSSGEAGGNPVVLTWDRPTGTSTFEIEISAEPDFDPVLTSESSTTNRQYVPKLQLPDGELYWRVRAKAPVVSAWSEASFTHGLPAAPNPVRPVENAVLQPPGDTPRFNWEPVPGATKYTIEAGPDPLFTDPDLVARGTFNTTAVVMTAYQAPSPDAYYWRVRAELGSTTLTTAWSEPRPYFVRGLLPARLTAPADDFAPIVEEVVLDWEPVAGAVTYELQVNTDENFLANNFGKSGITGTRYSPEKTFNNDEYYWRVRPVDVTGKSPAWETVPIWRFRRAWDNQPTLLHPAPGSVVATSPSAPFFYEWTSTELASKYEVQLYDDEGTLECTFKTVHTTVANACLPEEAGVYRWKVQAIDESASPAPLSDVISQQGAVFSYEPAPDPTPSWPLTVDMVTGQATSITGTAAYATGGDRDACTATIPATCVDLRQTPVLTWNPVPGAVGYKLVVSRDKELTNLISTTYVTDAIWTSDKTLADSQAGSAYFWTVQPCDSPSRCAPPQHAQHSFAKKSLAPGLLSPAPDALVSDDVTLDWTSELEALRAPGAAVGSSLTTPAATEAREYVVETATDALFTQNKQSATVDQTTFTSFASTYLEGFVYWRVRAVDGSGNPTVWSETRRFEKRSPVPQLVSPADSATLTSDYTLTWEPLPFAQMYKIEIKTSAGATVGTYDSKHSSWAPEKPFPVIADSYTWRVQRVDASNRVGAWSAPRTFRMAEVAPALTSPSAAARVVPNASLFTWLPDARSAKYRFEVRRVGSGSALRFAETVNPAWALLETLAGGEYEWHVISYDNQGKAQGTSPWRTFSVVDTPQSVTPVSISGSGKVGTELQLNPPTFDPGAESITYQWYRGTNSIGGQTGETYTVTSSDLTRPITVRATGVVTGYQNATSTSNEIMGVGGDALVAEYPPVIQGEAKVGQTLTVQQGSWPSTPNLSYQWYRDGVAISRATSTTYKLVADDVGRDVHVVETAKVSGRTDGTSASEPVDVQSAGTLTSTSPPTVSGTHRVGQRLSASVGSWSTSASYRYQWLRNGAAISGATSSSYTVVAADAARQLQVRISATAAGWDPGTATSAARTVPKVASTTTLSLSRARATARQAVVVTARVASGFSAPGGTVTFYDGSRRLKVVRLTRNSAALRLPRLRVGRHTIKAVYSGGTQVAGSTRAATLTITR